VPVDGYKHWQKPSRRRKKKMGAKSYTATDWSESESESVQNSRFFPSFQPFFGSLLFLFFHNCPVVQL